MDLPASPGCILPSLWPAPQCSEGQAIPLFARDGEQTLEIEQYLVDGASGPVDQAALEVERDSEVAGAIAPRATWIIYEWPARGG